MEAPDTYIARTTTMLLSLCELDDHELCALVARAQSLLLDRPARRDDALRVEIVDRQEGDLLTVYRGLAPLAQRHLVDRAQRLSRRPWPGRTNDWSRPSLPGTPIVCPRSGYRQESIAQN